MARSMAMATRGKQKPKRDHIIYLAGIIDADGSVSISRATPRGVVNPRYVLEVNVVNTSTELMAWLLETFGGRMVARRMSKPEVQRPTFDWKYSNGKAMWLLELVEPFLIVKRERAQLGIKLIKHWTTNHGQGARLDPDEVARREFIYQRMKELNRFGIVQPQRLSLPAPAETQDDAIV